MQSLTRNQWVKPIKAQRAREMRRAPTAAEQILWQALRGRQVAGAKFRRQQVAFGFIVDFYCDEHHLAVEVDGSVHDARQDGHRDAVLNAAGITVMRFTNEQVMRQLPMVLAVLHKHLTSIPPVA